MKILKYIKVYILTILISCILFTVVSIIPREYIKDNVIQGLQILEQEGLGKLAKFGYNARLDNFSDAVILNTIFSLDEKSPFISAMNATNIIVPDNNMELGNPIISLRNLIDNESGYSYNYSRYWHGYIVYIKLLLLFFNYSTIRIILTAITIILGLILLWLLYKKLGILHAIFTLYTMFIISYQIVGMSLQYFPVFFIATLTSIYLLLKSESKIDAKLIFFLVRWNY